MLITTTTTTLHTTIQIQSHSSLKIIQIITITVQAHIGMLRRVSEIIITFLVGQMKCATAAATTTQRPARDPVVQSRLLTRPKNGNQVSYCFKLSYTYSDMISSLSFYKLLLIIAHITHLFFSFTRLLIVGLFFIYPLYIFLLNLETIWGFYCELYAIINFFVYRSQLGDLAGFWSDLPSSSRYSSQ